MLNPQKTILSRLKFDYSIAPSLREKYAEMLVSRAVRFYLENELDSSVVEEDLIPFCKTCGDELDTSDTPINHFTPEEADHKPHIEYCNLDHSIEHEEKYQKMIIGYNKSK